MKYKGTNRFNLRSLEELLPPVIIGAEGEEDGADGGEGGSEDAGSDESNQSQDRSADHDDADDPKVIGLKSALERERNRNRKLEREIAARNKAKEQEELAKKSEVEQLQIKLQQSNDRVSQLAAGFLQRSLDSAIEKAARDMKFIDTDDALRGVDRAEIEVTQDEEDPTKVMVDSKSVEKAVKALATKKPHFLRTGTDDGEPTGSQFGGSQKKKPKVAEDAYKQKYPSLR